MSGEQNQYGIGLDKTPANFVALTPLSFLVRSAAVYPDHVSTVYEGRTITWSQTHARCRRFASYLAGRGIGRGDTVAAMLPNIPAMNEVHFAVPMAGAVLNALNIRLDASSIAFQLDHGGAKLILVDPAEGIRPIWGYLLALLVGLIVVAIFPWISIGFLSK